MIDGEIARLTQARDLLRGAATNGRPKATTNHRPKTRRISPAVRKKMSQSMQRRWREARKNGHSTLSR